MWDGRFHSLLICQEAMPELYEELARLSPRSRAERLRFLAGLGLMVARGNAGAVGSGTGSVRPEQIQPAPEKPKPNIDPRRKSAAANLLGSLG